MIKTVRIIIFIVIVCNGKMSSLLPLQQLQRYLYKPSLIISRLICDSFILAQFRSISFIFMRLLPNYFSMIFCFQFNLIKNQHYSRTMSKKDMTLVYYYVPEDKDDPDCPNVFGVPHSKANIRLSHIHQLFPLKGSYIYRLKHNHEGSTVWLDLPDLQSKLPTYKDRIIVKATRVSWSDSKLHSQYKEKQAINSQIPKKVEEVNVFEASLPSQPAKQVETKQHQQQTFNNSHNLLDQKTTQVHTNPQTNYSGFNLFDGVNHNNTNFGANSAGQKPQPIDFMHDFKNGDLI